MGLFGFGRKKTEEKENSCCAASNAGKSSTCCCGSDAATDAASCCCGSNAAERNACCCDTSGCCSPAEGSCCGNPASIKVLGAGCKSCHEQYDNVKAAVKALELNADVEYVTDMERVMAYGAMSMPAIVVNEELVSMGRVLKVADVEKLFRKLGF